MSEIAQRHKVYRTQIHQWRRKLLGEPETIFADGRSRSNRDDGKQLVRELFEQIGRLKMENEWPKKICRALLRLVESWSSLTAG